MIKAYKTMPEDTNEFEYKVSHLPGKFRQIRPLESVKAPRNRAKLNMYILFIIGSLALVALSAIAVRDVNFYGSQTYIQYFTLYWQRFGWNATTTASIMLVVNIFWIIINILIEFLANSQEWIPEKIINEDSSQPQTKKESYLDAEFNKIAENIETENTKITKEIEEDNQEYEAILGSATLSPLAFIWLFSKRIYRFSSRIPRRLGLAWQVLLEWKEELWKNFTEVIKNSWEVIIYFLNPFNIIEEIIDFAVIVLVKFLYPVLLTPIIFFLPVKLEYVFTHWWEGIIYFFIIGGLRVGVEFFSIYIRFLRNTRS